MGRNESVVIRDMPYDKVVEECARIVRKMEAGIAMAPEDLIRDIGMLRYGSEIVVKLATAMTLVGEEMGIVIDREKYPDLEALMDVRSAPKKKWWKK